MKNLENKKFKFKVRFVKPGKKSICFTIFADDANEAQDLANAKLPSYGYDKAIISKSWEVG